MSGLGLIISPDHEQALATAIESPMSFAVGDTSHLPDEWHSEIPARNQGSFSCCVGGGLSGCFEHRQFVETGKFIRYSMWQAYIAAQRRCGMEGRDEGATLLGALDAAGGDGCSLNDYCPMPSSYTTRIPQEAVQNALQHKHLGNARYDLRNWSRMMDWVTNKDPVLIGTVWRSGHTQLNARNFYETASTARNGAFLGYHCRYLCGWLRVNGVLVPRVRNTHSEQHGDMGTSIILPDAWEEYVKDPYTVCLGFGDIQEVKVRRNWSTIKSGETC